MKNDTIIYIGLDTHKEFTEVVYTGSERRAEFAYPGKIKTTKQGFVKLVRQLQSRPPQSNPALCLRSGALWATGFIDY